MPISMALAGPVSEAIGLANTFLIAGVTPLVLRRGRDRLGEAAAGRARAPARLTRSFERVRCLSGRAGWPRDRLVAQPLRPPVRAGGRSASFAVLSIVSALLTWLLVRRGLHTPFAIRRINRLSPVVRRPGQATDHGRRARRGQPRCSRPVTTPRTSPPRWSRTTTPWSRWSRRRCATTRRPGWSRDVPGYDVDRAPGQRDHPARADRDARPTRGWTS